VGVLKKGVGEVGFGEGFWGEKGHRWTAILYLPYPVGSAVLLIWPTCRQVSILNFVLFQKGYKKFQNLSFLKKRLPLGLF
jgi:hypothetical protein